MAELVCLDCFTTYESLVGHYCFNGWWIPGVASRSTIVQAVAAEPDSLKQESTHGTCVQINETASVGTELVNINPESSNENYLYNQVTYAEDQPNYSSQDYTTGGANNQLMAMNSEQNNVEECAISGLNNLALFCRNELGANDCNMEMRQSSEISSKFDRLTSMVRQFGLDGDNLNIPSIPISSNNKPDIPVSGAINCMPTYNFPTLDVFEDVQLEPQIQNHTSKLINNLVERRHNYETNSVSNDDPVINENCCGINHELIMGNKSDSEIGEDHIPSSEMYHQLSKYGKSTQRILIRGDLERMINNFAVTEAEPNRHEVLSNIPTHGSPVHTGSINDQIGLNRTNTVMIHHKCTNASTEGKIGLNDIDVIRGTKESATTRISCTEKSDSFENCPVECCSSKGQSFLLAFQ
ncbi:hypothetical protein AVEN_113136-1 [Araneus ventricosus]|uniref:Uncharacterized protein n=1 Tax=Araneus ventricosus TaxID=182803 RepID=A0A4Y2MUU4_ARAVE|nr:hypothetical protein AVEN_113136-1 [Araneus ventricosus]